MSLTPSGSHLNIARLHSPLPFSNPPTPSVNPLQIGVVGLGNIGYPLARNLALHLSKSPNNLGLVVFNRTKAKSEQLVEEVSERSAQAGGITTIKIAESVEEVAKTCDVIITSLSSDLVVEQVYRSMIAAIKDDPDRKVIGGRHAHKIFVETSTVYPKLTGKLDSLVTSIPHVHFVAAPVFGAPAAADKAQLIIILAGDYKSKKEVAYLLVPAVGRKVIDLGGNVEKAAGFKLIGNAFIAGTVELLAETYTLAEKSGIGCNIFHGFIQEMFPAPPIVNYGSRMVTDNFDGSTGFALEGGIKDVAHVKQLSADLNAPMPILDIVHQHLLTTRALSGNIAKEERKHEVLDWSAMISASRIATGMDPFDSSKHQSGVILEDEDAR